MKSIEKLRDQAKRSKNLFYQDVLDRLDEIEREIAEGYAPLPVDADGIVWKHDDDWFRDKHGEKYPLECMKIERDGSWLLRSPLGWHLASNCHHVKPRTVEDVLEDFLDAYDKWNDYSNGNDRMRERELLFSRFADELQMRVTNNE